MERRVWRRVSGGGGVVQRVFSRFSRSRRMAAVSWARCVRRVRGLSVCDWGSSSSRRSKTESVTGPRSSRLVSRSAIPTSYRTKLARGRAGKSSDKSSVLPPRRNRLCPCSERAAIEGAPQKRTLPTPPVFAGRSLRRSPPELYRLWLDACRKGRARRVESFDENERAPNVPAQSPARGARRRPGCVRCVLPAGTAPARQVERCHCYPRRPLLKPSGAPQRSAVEEEVGESSP